MQYISNKIHKKLVFCSPLNYTLFFLLIIFPFFSNIIILYFPDVSYAQNLSSSISLKANAGEDQLVEEGKTVILNAEDSLSSDSPIDSYSWFQVEPKNPLLDIKNSNTSKASFLSPNLPYDSNFVFQLIVKDRNLTDIDIVNIFVAEDLTSINKVYNVSGGNYQPEQCVDGRDNDLDGKIDIQDEECNLTLVQETGQVLQAETPRYQPFQNGVTDPQQQQQMQPYVDLGPDGYFLGPTGQPDLKFRGTR
jgi:hypothetical protein